MPITTNVNDHNNRNTEIITKIDANQIPLNKLENSSDSLNINLNQDRKQISQQILESIAPTKMLTLSMPRFLQYKPFAIRNSNVSTTANPVVESQSTKNTDN